MGDLVLVIINAVIYLFAGAVLGRVILSFANLIVRPPHPQWLIGLDNFLISVTEPVLGPVRRMLPSMGGLDFSPMVVLIILMVIRAALSGLGG